MLGWDLESRLDSNTVINCIIIALKSITRFHINR